MTVLDLDEVKRIAKIQGCALISYSEKSRVISFRNKGDNSSIRINVYWSTGTVGTCLDHPRQGKTQLFRRNVDLSTLREIFKNPQVHTGAGYYTCDRARKHIGAATPPYKSEFSIGDRVHVKGFADATIVRTIETSGILKGKIQVRYGDYQTYHVQPNQLTKVQQPLILQKNVSDDKECQDLENEARMQLKSLDGELRAIQDERAKVLEIINHFEQEREQEQKRLEEAVKRKQEAEADAERDRLVIKKKEEEDAKKALLDCSRSSRGKYIDYNICHSNQVSKQFDETVVSMACGGSATIFLYENGRWACTSGLSDGLYNKLNGRQRKLPSPVYVAMGSEDRYYIRFADGSSLWICCNNLSRELKQKSNGRVVKTVAFGIDWDSYFVVYTDGYWSYINVPCELMDIMEKRQNKSDLNCVSLGPNGEYFVSAKNGRAWWGGMTTENMGIAKRKKDGIKFMDFGDNYKFFVRYS